MNLNFKIQTEKSLGDLRTPVQMYLKLRDIYPNALLLESSDYHSKSDAHSFICLQPIATIEVNKGLVTETYLNNETKSYALKGQELAEVIKNFAQQFKIEANDDLKVIVVYQGKWQKNLVSIMSTLKDKQNHFLKGCWNMMFIHFLE